MTLEQMQHYATQGYNCVPVCKTVLADLDTPVSAYIKLANQPYSYLLESVEQGAQWGRYSVIGLACSEVIKFEQHALTHMRDGKTLSAAEHIADPLTWIADFAAQRQVPTVADLPPFTGGLVGYFGHETVRFIEPKLGDWNKVDLLGNPDILLMVSDELVIFDNHSGKMHLIVHVDPSDPNALSEAQERLERMSDTLNHSVPLRAIAKGPAIAESDFVSGFPATQYKEGVQTIRKYIRDGDVMQVVVSQRMSVDFESEPMSLYRALRTLNPSPYMYYFDLDDFHVVGSSPEILVRCQNDGSEKKITVRPIAGTRKRGATPELDLALERELKEDPKEVAEHLMLIDLGRNDVGRVAKVGSVELTEKMIIERYSHVMHISSNVTGTLQAGLTAMDALRATFPAGTLSGAPKIRALQIIDELEPVKRGVYGGAVGYLSWTGEMDTAIAIRTAVIKDQKLYVQAGAGIVADSVPDLEWEETMNKARAMIRAVDIASRGVE